MKKYTSYFILSVLGISAIMSGPLYAQSCPPVDITTNPNGPLNTQVPAMTNTFDWTQTYWPNERLYGGSTILTSLTNPFIPANYTSGTWQKNTLLNDSPHNPKDGWEIIARGDGFTIEDLNNNGLYDDYDATTTLPIVDYPYIVLYNKYSGILRVGGKIPAAEEGYQSANIWLTYLNETNSDPGTIYDVPVPSTYTNGLLNFHTNPALPLDQNVAYINAVMPTNFFDQEKYFFADLTVAYDPCVCTQQSGFKVGFTLIKKASIYLGGRILASSVDLTYTDPGGPLQINNDYLSSIYMDNNYTAQNGQHTFKDLTTMEDYYQHILDDQSNPLATFFSGILNMLLTFGGEALGDMIPEMVGETFPDNADPNEVAAAKGLAKGGISGIFDFFSSTLDAEKADDQQISPPRVITGEIALHGQITEEKDYSDPSFNFAAPASMYAETFDDYTTASHAIKYPLYNEKLGVFNVLRTPIVDYAYVCWKTLLGPDCYIKGDEISYGIFDLYRLNPNLKYAFNDLLDIDYEHTKIFGALEFTIENPYTDNIVLTKTNCGTLYAIDKRLIQVSPPASSDNIAVYSSPLMPIDALPSQVYKIFNDDGLPGGGLGTGYNNVQEVDLQLVIDITYNAKDHNGNPIKHLLMVKFPMVRNQDILSNTDFNYYCNFDGKHPFQPLEDWLDDNIFNNPCDDLPTDLVLDATTFTTSQTIEVTGSVEIRGDLNTSSSGVNVEIRAGQFIGTGDPDIRIAPNIDLIVGLQDACMSNIQPMGIDEVNEFCSSKDYAAGAPAQRSYTPVHHETTKTEVGDEISLYPNPSTTNVNVISRKSPIRYLRVIDILGKDVSNLVDGFIYSGGTDAVNLNVSALPQGTYVIEITTDMGVQTKKLIKY